jgi:soluble lytic murein transglycosylase-like protein
MRINRQACALSLSAALLALSLALPRLAHAGDPLAVARQEYLRGRHKQVIATLRAYVLRNPGHATAWAWLGASLSHERRAAEAVTAFEWAYRIKPSYDLALWLGAVYAQAGRPADARRFLSAVASSGRTPLAGMASRWLRSLQGQTAPVLPEATSPQAYAAYSRVVRWYNPQLSGAQVDAIVRSVLYFSTVYHVDPRLVMALIAVESGFQVTARSPAGAYGLGQLMPATWRAMGVHPGDPVANVYATVRVLKGNMERLGGDPVLALAAYNAGRGAVEQYTGIPPYRETQWYVYNVLAVYQHFAGLRPSS